LGYRKRESHFFFVFSYLKKNKQTTNLVGCVVLVPMMKCVPKKRFLSAPSPSSHAFYTGAVTPFFCVVLHSLFFSVGPINKNDIAENKKKKTYCSFDL
jgi:hypothetical protein